MVGFRKIQNLEEYHQLKVIYLEGNGTTTYIHTLHIYHHIHIPIPTLTPSTSTPVPTPRAAWKPMDGDD
jgi:hypothetical protein